MEHMRGVERMGLVKSFAYRRPRHTFPLELTLGIFKRFKLLEPWQKRDYILEVDLNNMDDIDEDFLGNFVAAAEDAGADDESIDGIVLLAERRVQHTGAGQSS